MTRKKAYTLSRKKACKKRGGERSEEAHGLMIWDVPWGMGATNDYRCLLILKISTKLETRRPLPHLDSNASVLRSPSMSPGSIRKSPATSSTRTPAEHRVLLHRDAHLKLL